MKGILFGLLAVVVGIGMVGGGLYGVVKGDDDDDTTTSSLPSAIPGVPQISTRSVGACDTAAERDPRLARIEGFRLRPSGDERGLSADLRPICNGSTVVIVTNFEGLDPNETVTYNAWLYGGRRKARQVGTLIGTGGRAFGSIVLSPDVDTTPYDSIVVSRTKFGQTEQRPRRIVFRGSL